MFVDFELAYVQLLHQEHSELSMLLIYGLPLKLTLTLIIFIWNPDKITWHARLSEYLPH